MSHSNDWVAIFERLAALLSDRWGIRVIMRGTEAHTDGKTIVLPALPDNAPDDLVAAVHGTLDHEAGHVIFSEFFAIPDPLEKFLVNALEDAREEVRLIGIWPGCAQNLHACTEFFSRRLAAAGWPLSDFAKFCIALYFSERFGDDHWFVREWVDPCVAIQPHVRVAKEILARESVHACATTRDVHALARKILAAVRDLASERAEPPPSSADDARTAERDPGEDPSHGDGRADAPPAPVPGSEAGTEDEAAAGSGGSDADREPPSSEDAEATSGERPEDQEPGDGATTAGAAPTPEPAEPTHDITAVAPAELRRDAEWTVQRMLSERAREALAEVGNRYAVYTTEFDGIATAPEGDRATYRRTIQTSQGEVAALKRTLARTLLASRKTRWERGLGRGKIDPAALHKLPVGIERRVFRRREEAPAFNTRVCLLVDHSGSMMSSRIALAARAASAFSEVLAQLRIPFELLGFTSGSHGDGQRRYRAAKPEERDLFARWGALRTIVYKSFSEDFRRVCGRLESMAHYTGGEGNYDGDSVLLAARRLARASKPDERRILFVFSDGCPAGTVTHAPLWARQIAHLHAALGQVRASGIELFGIGIESDAVQTYYAPDFVVVNSAADLPRETVRALDRMLRGGLVRQS
jgi:cobalamin biosynthesis protein CobT